MSMNQQEVSFVETPVIGQPVKIICNNQQIMTSPVVDIQTNPNWPDVMWVRTQSGSIYYGRSSFQKTTILNPNQTQVIGSTPYNERQQPYQPLPWQPMSMSQNAPKNDMFPDWAIIAALLLFTPLGVYAMWYKCNWLRQVKWTITAAWLVCLWLWLISLGAH